MDTMTKTHAAMPAVAAGGNDAIAPQSRPSMGILTPTSLAEAMQMANILADSTIVPAEFRGKPGNVLIACQWGAEIGLQPLQAMQSIAVINGRPSIWGDAMLGLVQGSGLLESIDEQISDDGDVATCTLRRRGQEKPVIRTFTMDEAKKAGLAGKTGPWQQYPRRMLQLRARGFALRDAFADVLRGVAIAEEARDTPVMRDVTDETETPPETTAAKIRGKIGSRAKAKDKASLDDLLREIAAAADEAALIEIGAKAKDLADEADRGKARAAYRDRLAEIRNAQTPASAATEGGTGDMFGITPEQQAEMDAAEAEFRSQS